MNLYRANCSLSIGKTGAVKTGLGSGVSSVSSVVVAVLKGGRRSNSMNLE